MREKGATERPQAFRYERAPDRYARMPCQYVRLPFHVERTSIRIERMSFRLGRIRGSFRFARQSFQINAISVPLCAISWDYSRSNICNARSIFREKAFHFRAHAQKSTRPRYRCNSSILREGIPKRAFDRRSETEQPREIIRP